MPKAVYLWTGEGWGKTTSALGVALRAIGHGKKVEIIQFMKGRKERIGEYKVRKRLGPLYSIHQFGRKGWVNLKIPSEHDTKLAHEGMHYAYEAIKKKPFLLILDEINIATRIGLFKPKDVIDLLRAVPKETTVYLTGRRAPPELIKRADYVCEIKDIKRKKGTTNKSGIDY